MSTHHDALLHYYIDLHDRFLAQQEWKQRHSDWQSDEYQHDEEAWNQSMHTGWSLAPSVIFRSSFDPSDPMPSTSDVLSVQFLLNLMRTTLDAYDKAHQL